MEGGFGGKRGVALIIKNSQILTFLLLFVSRVGRENRRVESITEVRNEAKSKEARKKYLLINEQWLLYPRENAPGRGRPL